jgi:Holliday junction DNA helicase RuvA
VIGYLSGLARPGNIILDKSGVGWKVQTPMPLAAGDPVELHITTIVREDAITLYGFEDTLTQACFESLTKVSGVGPSIALQILGQMSAEELAGAVTSKDAKAFSKVKGVGVKVAEKIITLVKLPQGIDAKNRDEIVEALIGMGWDAEHATRAVTLSRGENHTDEEILMGALQELGRN